MPQMSPLKWFLLFILFSSIFLLFNLISFYSFFYTPNSSSSKISVTSSSMNWMW